MVLSSFSVATALAMTYNGAKGDTRKAIHNVLGLGELTLNELNSAHASLSEQQTH